MNERNRILDRVHVLSDGLFEVSLRKMREVGAPTKATGRLLICVNMLLFRSDEGYLLVDSGMGEVVPDAVEAMTKQSPTCLATELDRVGVAPGEIGHVILTHLHYDHMGGLMRKNGDALLPDAEVWVQKDEWHRALSYQGRFPKYFGEYLSMLRERMTWHEVEGDFDLMPGIRMMPTGGHSTGHQMVVLSAEGGTVCCPGDLFPTAHTLNDVGLDYDDHPESARRQRLRLREEVLNKGWYLFFSHSPRLRLGFPRRGPDRIEIENLEPGSILAT